MQRDAGLPFGRYRRGHRIAVGGMGEVFHAWRADRGPGQPLALKLLLPDLAQDPELVRMFLDEARMGARMRHPNVLAVSDVGREQGRYFLAMELVRGASLAALVRALRREQGQLDAGLLRYVGRALCEALHHVHGLADESGRALNLVHRDVTPHNVLASVSGEVKLTDFGIAKAATSGARTRTGHVKGKIEYLAPEQLRGKAATRASDLYSTGITLYQLATLASPFRRDNEGATVRAIEHEALSGLEGLRPDLPRPLVDALYRVTSKDPAARFASAPELRDALGEPDPGAPQRLGHLVLKLCGEELAKLECPAEGGRQTASLELVAQEAVTASSHQRQAPVATPSPSPGRAGFVAAALAIVTGVLAAGYLWQAGRLDRARPADELPVSEAVLAPTTTVDAPVAPAPAPPTVLAATAPTPPTGGETRQAGATPRPAAGKPRSSQRARAAPEPAQAVTGFLAIDAAPWARVTVNGKAAGDTPIARFPVEGAKATVVFESPETGKRVVKKVRVRHQQKTPVWADLR